MLEQDMYQSIKTYLTNQGYTVRAEVLHADITAIKEEEIIIIEMKKTLNTRLLYQGCKRQRICDYVYLAIIEPTSKIKRSPQFKEKIHLVRRLQLGLIYVNLESNQVTPFLDPKTFALRKSKIKKRKLLTEFNQRTTSLNIGGVTKTKIITAYREKAIRIAYYLSNGPLKLKEITTLTNDPKCASILQKNYYNWFIRVSRGLYNITDIGIEGLNQYAQVVELLFPDASTKQVT